MYKKVFYHLYQPPYYHVLLAENDTETETPTEGIWDDDHLERWKDAKFLHRFLVNRIAEHGQADHTKSYVLNLDAKWGGGKTFFLTRFQKQLEAEGHLVAYINAWEDDHAPDPLIPIIAAIDQTLKPYLTENSLPEQLWKGIKGIGFSTVKSVGVSIFKGASKYALQEGADEIAELFADSEFEKIKEATKLSYFV